MAYASNIPKEEQKRLALEKVEKSFAKINSDVVTLFDKDAMPRFLAFMARFHYFDIYNLILVYKQRPEATFVASFKTWEKIGLNRWHDPGRPVFQGSQTGQGIGILAPYILKKKLENSLDMKSASFRTKVIPYLDYHVVFVFDKAQVNNIPSPVMDWDLSNNKIDAEAAFHGFLNLAPFDIVFSYGSGFKGNFVFEDANPRTQKKPTLVLNAKYKFDYMALCNFILRIFVAHSMPDLKEISSPDEFEKYIECVSYAIASYFGFSTDEYFFFFMRSWASNSSDMLSKLNAVRYFIHTLITALEIEICEYKASLGDAGDLYAFDDDDDALENMRLW